MSQALAGTASLTVNGVSYALRGAFTYSPVRVKRETISGQDAVHGFKEMPTPGWVSADLTDTGGLSVAALNAMTNVTIVAQLKNGKVIVGVGLWTVDAQEVDTAEAKLTVKWEGTDGCVTEN